MKQPKDNLKICGVRIGSANRELLEIYCKKNSIKTHQKAARKIVEEQILGHKCLSAQDVENAIFYAENMLYNSLAEAVEQVARGNVFSELNICQNCAHYGNGVCVANRTQVHAFSSSCINMERKKN